MTWGEMARLAGRPAATSRGAAEVELDKSSTSEVLLQVVLPIVLILAFFAMSSARSFEEKEDQLERMIREISAREARLEQRHKDLEQQRAAMVEREREIDQRQEQIESRAQRLHAWWQEVTQTDPAALGLKLSEAYIELQKQQIVAALETIENEERTNLGLSVLASREFRVDDSGKIVDENRVFVGFCREVEEIFRNSESYARRREVLLGRVLEKASLVALGRVRDLPVPAELGKVSDGRKAQRGEITDDNLKFLVHHLEKFLAGLRVAVAYEQLRAINGIFTHYQQGSPAVLYRWIPTLQTMKNQLISIARSGGDVSPLELAIRRKMYRQLQADFESWGCDLLPEVTEYQ